MASIEQPTRRLTVIALAVLGLAVGAAACGSGTNSAARVRAEPGDPTVTTAGNSGSVDAFRTAVIESPFYGTIDWSPPATTERLAALSTGGAVGGVVEDVVASAPQPFTAFNDSESEPLPNSSEAVTVGVELVIRVDAAGAKATSTFQNGDTVSVRLDLWTGPRRQVEYAEEVVERTLSVAPVGARVVVPVVADGTSKENVVALLGTPVFVNSVSGRLVALDQRLDPLVGQVPADQAVSVFDPS